MKLWELWYADFPFEETKQTKCRPVIILNMQPIQILTIKVTSHSPRKNDIYDTPIIKWRQAGLKRPFVARVSKTMTLDKNKFKNKIGELQQSDIAQIQINYLKYLTDQMVDNGNIEEDKEVVNSR